MMLEHLRPEEMAALYQRTAVLVHPPRYEAYGMAVVEAVACGADVVMDNAGASVCAAAAFRASRSLC